MNKGSAAKKAPSSNGDYVVERVGNTVLLLRPVRQSVIDTTKRLTADRTPIRTTRKK